MGGGTDSISRKSGFATDGLLLHGVKIAAKLEIISWTQTENGSLQMRRDHLPVATSSLDAVKSKPRFHTTRTNTIQIRPAKAFI